MSLSDRITKFDEEIANFDMEIAAIDGEVIGATAVQAAMSDRRATLVSRKNRITVRKDRIQALIDNPVTNAQQTVIDSINTLFNNKYISQMSQFDTMTTEERSNFFDIYNQAGSDVCKECFIRNFFSL